MLIATTSLSFPGYEGAFTLGTLQAGSGSAYGWFCEPCQRLGHNPCLILTK